MNQRIKRSRNRKDFSTMATGGHVVNHAPKQEAEVRTPSKATGDVKGDNLSGLAKASPFFKKVTERVLGRTEKEKAEAIEENVEKKNVSEPGVEEQDEDEHYHE